MREQEGNENVILPARRKYFSTLADTYLSSRETDSLAKTHIRICICKGRREIATVPLSFCFRRPGEYWHRCATPLLLAKSVAGPIYTTTKKKRRKKGRERRPKGSRKVQSSTDRNKQSYMRKGDDREGTRVTCGRTRSGAHRVFG